MKQIVTLKNGLKVGNFGSPHQFTFDDGTVLPAASFEDCKKSMVTKMYPVIAEDDKYTLCNIEVELTTETMTHIDHWQELIDNEEVDLVIVPRIIRDAINKHDKEYLLSEFVCSVLVDTVDGRINKIIRSNLFCL